MRQNKEIRVPWERWKTRMKAGNQHLITFLLNTETDGQYQRAKDTVFWARMNGKGRANMVGKEVKLVMKPVCKGLG